MSSKNVPNDPRSPRRRARHWSISRRLTVLYAASSFLMLVLATAYLYWSLVGNLDREDNAFLADKIRVLRTLLRERPQEMALLREEAQSSGAAPRPLQYYVRVLDSKGGLVVESPGMSKLVAGAKFPRPASADELPQEGVELDLSGGRSLRLMSAWAKAGTPGGEPFLIEIALDTTNDEALMVGFRRRLLALVVVGMLFAWAAGVFIARKGLQPLEEMARATERVSASQLHERIVADGWPKELVSLATGFDRMLDRLEDSFARLSQFSGDLAHELRTPINNLRGEAGVALSQARSPDEYRRVLESSLEEYARLTRLIENLLFLARADSPAASVSLSTCHARAAIEAVREYYEALADDRGVQVICEGEATVEADATLLRQAVSNLLANALNATPRGGTIRLRVAAHQDGGVELTVSDTGTGIAAEHLSKIFDRFYRPDPARSQPGGSGLGLSIVKSIMLLHGGTVTVQSDVGRGSDFTLRFPPASAVRR